MYLLRVPLLSVPSRVLSHIKYSNSPLTVAFITAPHDRDHLPTSGTPSFLDLFQKINWPLFLDWHSLMGVGLRSWSDGGSGCCGASVRPTPPPPYSYPVSINGRNHVCKVSPGFIQILQSQTLRTHCSICLRGLSARNWTWRRAREHDRGIVADPHGLILAVLTFIARAQTCWAHRGFVSLVFQRLGTSNLVVATRRRAVPFPFCSTLSGPPSSRHLIQCHLGAT